MAQPCEAKFNKYAKEYREWEREAEDASNWGLGLIFTELVAGATCIGSLGLGCAAGVAGTMAAYAQFRESWNEEITAAEEANGAFAEYLVCAMQHKNFYRGVID
jgi:hypothetical protein